jgi:hypothetical protein
MTLKYTKRVSLIKNFNGLLSLSITLISINLTIKKMTAMIPALTNIDILDIVEHSYL